MTPFAIDPDQDTISDVIRRWAQTQADAQAFVQEGRPPLTYGALAAAMDGVTCDLRRAGFGRGDRVALIHRGGQPMAPLILGISGGATLLPLNPNLTEDELADQLRARRATALVIEPEAPQAGRAAVEVMGIPVLTSTPAGDGLLSAEGAPLTDAVSAGVDDPVRSSDTAMVLVTSGTTSEPKLVPFSHRLALARGLSENAFFERTSDDVCLCPQRLYYANGLNQMISSLTCGSALALTPSFTVETFFRYLRELGLTCVSASVPFLHRIHESMDAFAGQGRDHALRYIRATSGSLAPDVADALEEFFGVPILENYSSSETCRICCNPLPPRARKRGTVGPPSDCEVRIRTLDGRFVGPGERGEVVLRGNRIIEGYEDNAQANAEAYVDGWWRTGDEGIIDEDGYLRLTGRIKEMINRGGEKVSPAEVDAAAMAHPEVAEAAAFPIAHPTLGEEVALTVVREPGSEISEDALARFLLGRLSGFKVPRRIFFVDAIPKSDAGRVQRYRLADDLDLDLTPQTEPAAAAESRTPTPLEFRLQRIWQRILNRPHVGLDDNFFLLGGDSLIAVDLFLQIELELKHRLPVAALFEAGTVSEMARLIEGGEPQGCMVAIQPEGPRPPFFCVHGASGQVIGFYSLSRYLGPDQPLYGIQSIGWDRSTPPFTRSADMAAHYVEELRRVQPHGPYYLGGYSFGGRIAVYMADILRRAGEEVALLAIIDSTCLVGRRHVTYGQWLDRIDAPRGAARIPLAVRYAWFRIRKTYDDIYQRGRRLVLFPIREHYRTRGLKVPLSMARPDRLNLLIRHEHRKMPTYDGDAVYFRTAIEDRSMAHPDVKDAWSRVITGRLEVIDVPGTHESVIQDPDVRHVAEEIRIRIPGLAADEAPPLSAEKG